jgi:AsmA protein
MKPRQIPWKWLLVGVIALLFIGLALLPRLLGDSAKLASRATDALSAWSGGEVKLTGPLRVQYFPDVAIRGGFELNNASRFPLIKSVSADDVRISFDLAELLLGRLSIDAVRLARPKITLRDVPPAVMGPDQTLQARIANLLAGSPAGVVRIRDGTIFLSQAANGEAIKKVEARFDLSSGDGAMSSFGHFDLRNETVRFALDSSAPGNTGDGVRVPFTLTVNSKPVAAKGTGTASFPNRLDLDGTLQADMSSAREFLRWTGIALPEGSSLQNLSASGNAHWNGTTLSFDDGSFALDGNSAVGVLAITPGERPRLEGTLDFEHLALDPYIGGNQAGPASDGSFDQVLLKYFDADLRVSAAEITAPSLRLGRGGFTISAKTGLLASEVGELEFCGGAAAGHFGIDLSEEMAKASLTANVSNMPADTCLKLVAPGLPLTGLGGLKADLASEGRNLSELLQGLSGTLKVNAENGTVPIDLNRLLASTAPLDSGWSRDSATLFDELKADCRLVGGQISCQSFNMQTGRGLISGSGELDLARQKLDWSLFVATRDTPLKASQLSVETPPRISISGSLSQPMIRRADHPTLGEGSMQASPGDGQISPR